jgi:hypothetical protein
MNLDPSALANSELLDATRERVRRSNELDAELLLLLGEIEERRLYADRAFPSLFAFCVGELGFSEDAACNRIAVARLARRFPRILEFVADSRIHLTGLRLLAPVLTEHNIDGALTAACGKSKREIGELVAALAPRPPVPATIRKLPAAAAPATPLQPVPSLEPARPPPAAVKPLSAETFKVQFTADRPLKAKLEQAEELLRHRVPKGDLAAIVDRALDLLIAHVKKERFGVGRTPRQAAPPARSEPGTRHLPDGIKREVY